MATASGSVAAYAGSGVPPTQLPVDPHTRTRYLRSRQLAALRGLYEYKTLAVSHQIEQHAASLRGRHGRARRRRGSSPLEERNLEAEDDEDDLEVRKRMRYDPAAAEEEGGDEEVAAAATTRNGDDRRDGSVSASRASTPLSGARAGSQKAALPSSSQLMRDASTEVDPVHVYDYVYDLAPDASSDAYYHGAHPPPPARVVRTVLRATQRKPLVDPAGLSAAQLEALTAKLWEEEGKGLSIFFGEAGGSAAQKRRGAQPLSRDQERYQREVNAEAADEWELAVVAGFSARCGERIGTSLARKPMTAREMEAQAQAHSQAQAQARAGQPPITGGQQQPPHSAAPNAPHEHASGYPGPGLSQPSVHAGLPSHSQAQHQQSQPAAAPPVASQQQQQALPPPHGLPGYRGPGSGLAGVGGLPDLAKGEPRYGGPGAAAGWRW